MIRTFAVLSVLGALLSTSVFAAETLMTCTPKLAGTLLDTVQVVSPSEGMLQILVDYNHPAHADIITAPFAAPVASPGDFRGAQGKIKVAELGDYYGSTVSLVFGNGVGYLITEISCARDPWHLEGCDGDSNRTVARQSIDLICTYH